MSEVVNNMRFFRSRVGAAILLLSSALLVVSFVFIFVNLPSGVTLTDQIGDSTIHFSADRTRVFGAGECVLLEWDVEGVREVWLSLNPTVGQEQREWCVKPGASYSTPVLRVQLADETWHEYPITIEVGESMLIYLGLPLILGVIFVLLVVRFPAGFDVSHLENRKLIYALIEPFQQLGRLNVALVVVFLAINLIVLVNTIRHDPNIGYDATAHLAYVDVLAEFRLPTLDESYEAFSPPLSYVLPALTSRLLRGNNETCDNTCSMAAKKVGQLQNVIASLGITFYLLKICGIIRPNDMHLKILALVIFGMLPVYYKSLSAMRGEPFVVLFSLYLIYQTLMIFRQNYQPSLSDAVKMGIAIGLIMLSRQWGAFTLVAMLIWGILFLWKCRCHVQHFMRFAILSGLIAMVVGGWFYAHLYLSYGTLTAFNRQPRPNFTLNNHPPDFYYGLGDGRLFTSPFGLAVSDHLIPKFYTEIWGDSEGVFVLSASSPMPDYLLAYMGRVNAVSLFPTLILLLGIGLGAVYFLRFLARRWGDSDSQNGALVFLFLCVVVSISGYLWFIIRYPDIDGDTIKATYLLHIFPLTAILAGVFLLELRQRYPNLWRLVVATLVIVILHNLPVLFTRST